MPKRRRSFSLSFKKQALGMGAHWSKWFREGEKRYTKKGNRKPPSYQAIVDMVLEALKRISEGMIKKSFRVCGFAANGVSVPNEDLHSRLRNFLNEESDDDSDEESDDSDVSSEGCGFRSSGSIEF